jgi:hypothetical protein
MKYNYSVYLVSHRLGLHSKNIHTLVKNRVMFKLLRSNTALIQYLNGI